MAITFTNGSCVRNTPSSSFTASVQVSGVEQGQTINGVYVIIACPSDQQSTPMANPLNLQDGAYTNIAVIGPMMTNGPWTYKFSVDLCSMVSSATNDCT